MKSREFLTEQQEEQIIKAIKKAEKQTSAEVRVHIEHHASTEPLKRADKLFHDLGMTQTQQQNGVLIYVAHEDKQAAVYGGKGIHKHVEEGYWGDVLKIMLTHFKNGAFAEGIEKAVREVATKLSEFYPYHSDDVNELSDEISYTDNEK